MSNLILNPSKIAGKVGKCYPDLVSCLIHVEASFRGKYRIRKQDFQFLVGQKYYLFLLPKF